MFELKICCKDLEKRIGDGSVKVDFSSGVVNQRGRRIYKCPVCGRVFEWVD